MDAQAEEIRQLNESRQEVVKEGREEEGRESDRRLGGREEGKSPTEEFIKVMKEKMEALSKEEMEIEDAFEDFNQQSLKE